MELLEQHFDTALESPDGIKKLRELILTLAMQGKLVKQDPRDQPARELLKEIQAEKERLVAEGKIKRGSRGDAESSGIKPEEVPYTLPEGWEWVRLGEIGETQTGTTPATKDSDNFGDFIPFIGPGDIQNQVIDYNQNGLSVKGLSKSRLILKNSILMVCIGGSIGKHAVNTIDVACNQQINTITPITSKVKFLFYAMWSDNFQTNVILNAGGSATPIINKNKWSMIAIPLPPLAEQKRIVAKIDELMALCDRLEEQRKTRDRKRLAVHAAAMNGLLNAADKNEFDTSWQFITRNFDPLYSVKENVAELKKAILTLAMQGKLVKQDPNDQPARELLKEIQAEKERLIAEGKIKKQKELPPIKPEDVPYAVPEGWEWVRLGQCSQNIHYGYTASADFQKNEIHLLRITDIQNNQVNWESVPGCDIKTGEVDKYLLKQNDILIARTGGTVGKTYLVDDISVKAVFASYLIRVIPSPLIYIYFLKNNLESPFYWKQLYEKCSGTGQPNVNGVSLSTLLIPLPPQEEQKRIVARIDELMALCDTLEERIDRATVKQTALFDAVLARV